MTRVDPVLKRLREICLALPDTKETLTWGAPHFRVGEKIFAGYGEERGRAAIGFKLEMPHAATILVNPRFTRAPYVGHKGWVSMDVTRALAGAVAGAVDWNELRELIHESYRLIAPKRSLAKLSGQPGAPAAPEPARRKASKSARKRTAKKKKKAKKSSATSTTRRAQKTARKRR
jgi:predicted DNA-binding protein (MmcQ/YjbR family)